MGKKTRIYFVTDIHGSEICFRKFVNAGKYYKADAIILGGDITGKMIVPIVKLPDGTLKCNYTGDEIVMKSQSEIDQTTKLIRDSGYYPYFCSESEFAELNEKEALVKQLFTKMMVESVKGWMKLAEERLKPDGIKCYISPGNDDIFDIDEVLNSSSYVVNPEEKVVDIDGEHEMITLGTTNHTPWHSPREVDEEELSNKIENMTRQVRDMKKAIFNIHVPPIDTSIDQAPKLDENLNLVGAGRVMISAGSVATRRAIEKLQPLIGIHGHIHESKGLVKIGRTMCFNPGSEYGDGLLKGLVCDLEGDKLKSYLLAVG
jgi:Icc-related predicted phosphoesterase